MISKRALKIAVASITVIAVLFTGLYALIVWEGSNAREDAPVLEADVAQWLLHYTVPASFRDGAQEPHAGQRFRTELDVQTGCHVHELS